MQTDRPDTAVTFSVRLWAGQRQLLLAAAAAKRMTLPDWMMKRLLPLAAEDAGVPLPEFPPFPRRPFNSRAKQEEVAQHLGMSQKELQAQLEHLQDEWLEKVLAQKHSLTPPPPTNGTKRPRAKRR